ncbi:MAG: DUF1987 domain-containing protein [Bacteroidota bacterium]
METVRIAPTKITPEVLLESGRISITGRSRPENSSGFFLPILKWVEEYTKDPAPKTECFFKVEYINSASAKCFVDIMRLLEIVHSQGKPVTVVWNYDEVDDDMRETGEEYRSLFSMNFELVPY